MKNEMINTILLACGLVVLVVIAIVLATGSGEESHHDELGTHAHEEFVEKTGDTMTGDLVVQNLYTSGVVTGDGNGLTNLNASRINSGTLDSARLPSNINANTLDSLDSTDFALAAHDHNSLYYTETESDARFALVDHSHPSTGDADTLDGYDSTDFALSTHTHSGVDADTLDGYDSTDFAITSHNHDSLYYPRADVDSGFLKLSGGTLTGDLYLPNLYSTGVISGDGSGLLDLNASRITSGTIASARLPSDINANTLDGLDSLDFAMSTHNHDARYYQKPEIDANFLRLSGGSLTGDLTLLNLYASEIISGDGSGLTNLNASAISSGTIGIARLPPNINADTLDGFDSTNFAMAMHTHDAAQIVAGELAEARLPQNAIDESEIETGLGLVPSGTIVMWNGTVLPNGWALCDGGNGTPDLRGMFIVGYDSGDPDYDSIGNMGGEKTHTLTTNEMPAHTHTVSGSTNSAGNHFHSYEDQYSVGTTLAGVAGAARDDNENFQMKTTVSAGDHTHGVSGSAQSTGGDQAHENRPPYYVLAFIMKL
jgi:microcystin-dependent protein